MKDIDEAMVGERLTHYIAHLRARAGLSRRLAVAATSDEIEKLEQLRRATIEGVIEHLVDVVELNAPRYTTATEIPTDTL